MTYLDNWSQNSTREKILGIIIKSYHMHGHKPPIFTTAFLQYCTLGHNPPNLRKTILRMQQKNYGKYFLHIEVQVMVHMLIITVQ